MSPLPLVGGDGLLLLVAALLLPSLRRRQRYWLIGDEGLSLTTYHRFM
jgi:hypothetical protein